MTAVYYNIKWYKTRTWRSMSAVTATSSTSADTSTAYTSTRTSTGAATAFVEGRKRLSPVALWPRPQPRTCVPGPHEQTLLTSSLGWAPARQPSTCSCCQAFAAFRTGSACHRHAVFPNVVFRRWAFLKTAAEFIKPWCKDSEGKPWEPRILAGCQTTSSPRLMSRSPDVT